jgi:hypothetical protein
MVVAVELSTPEVADVDNAMYVAATAGLWALRNTAFKACCSAYWKSWPPDRSVMMPPR